MENLKQFMSNKKKTALLGLIGSIIMCMQWFISPYNHNILDILSKTHLFGFVLYFIMVLLNMARRKINMKVADYILIGSFVISIISNIIQPHSILDSILYLLIGIYLFGVLIIKKALLNNKLFAGLIFFTFALKILAVMPVSSSIYEIIDLILGLGFCAVVPHFYNKFYEVSNEIAEEIAPLGVRIVSFLFPFVGAIIYAINIKDSPEYAKSSGKYALYGFILVLIILVINILYG